MDVMSMKRRLMFTWVDDVELGWLFFLEEYEQSLDEFEVDSLAGLLKRLMENRSLQELRERSEALLGLQEEGFIAMEIEGDLDAFVTLDLRITQRGRKLLREAHQILQELKDKDTKTIIDVKLEEKQEALDKARRKEDQRVEMRNMLIDYGITMAREVLMSVLGSVLS